MYRKNVANQYIYFALVSTSTGLGLTGASVTAYRALDNGSQATATGTTSELGNGQYRFNLSQADTNADEGSYLFIATGASPVEKTVVFTAANPSDGAAFGLSKFADIETDTQDIQSRLPAALVGGRMASNAEVVGDKTGYTATVSDKTGFSLLAGTGLGNQTANITGNLSGSVGSVTGSVGSVTSAVSVSDKTGFKLASDGLALVTSWTVAITGNLTGNVTGSVGSISGVTFPDNFGSLDITVGGAIAELGAGALTANGAGDAIPGYVWGALLADHAIVNTFGARIVRSLNSNNTVQITGGGSYHIFSVMHDAEPNAIPEDAFQTGALSARVLAADASTEIATAVSALQVLSRLNSMIEDNGSGQFRFDTIAVSLAGGGGSGSTYNIQVEDRSITLE